MKANAEELRDEGRNVLINSGVKKIFCMGKCFFTTSLDYKNINLCFCVNVFLFFILLSLKRH